jgi:hypothetical protein
VDVRFAGEADGKCQLGLRTDWDGENSNGFTATCEDGRASVGLGSAWKDSGAIAIGGDGCAGGCWSVGYRRCGEVCDALTLCARCACVRGGKCSGEINIATAILHDPASPFPLTQAVYPDSPGADPSRPSHRLALAPSPSQAMYAHSRLPPPLQSHPSST